MSIKKPHRLRSVIPFRKLFFQRCRHPVSASAHIFADSLVFLSSQTSFCPFVSFLHLGALPLLPFFLFYLPPPGSTLCTVIGNMSPVPLSAEKMKNEDKLFLLICSLRSVRLTAERDRGKMEMADLPVHFFILTTKPTSEVWTGIPMRCYRNSLSCAANL